MAQCKPYWIHWLMGANSWLCKKLKICCKPEKPPIVEVEICEITELLAKTECRIAGTTRLQEFEKGQEPTDPCDYHFWKPVKICSSTELLPNPYCPKVIEREFVTGREPKTTCEFHEKPEPIIKKLPYEMSVPGLFKETKRPILIMPWLIPTSIIERPQYFDQTLFIKEAVDYEIENENANADRPFSFGGWEKETLERILHPFNRNDQDLFKLGSKNRGYLDQIKARISDRAERNWFSVVTLTDNCSTHLGNNPPYSLGFWAKHPWNGSQNVNGTSEWRPSIYHFYEPDKQDLPGIPQSARWIEDFIRWISEKLEDEFGEWIGWEITNEGQAGAGYHSLIQGWLVDSGVKEWKIWSSFDYDDFYKKTIWNHANYMIHGINTKAAYQKNLSLVPTYPKRSDLYKLAAAKYPWMKTPDSIRIPFVLSEDGIEPTKITGYRELIREALKAGDSGFESNSRPYFYARNLRAWLRDPKTHQRFDNIGKGFRDFLKG